ncbi:MAG: hypothetical protein R6V83_05755 [Candidatus Thorarchaeota archaeon]
MTIREVKKSEDGYILEKHGGSLQTNSYRNYATGLVRTCLVSWPYQKPPQSGIATLCRPSCGVALGVGNYQYEIKSMVQHE